MLSSNNICLETKLGTSARTQFASAELWQVKEKDLIAVCTGWLGNNKQLFVIQSKQGEKQKLLKLQLTRPFSCTLYNLLFLFVLIDEILLNHKY
jgi:hypothetical protein